MRVADLSLIISIYCIVITLCVSFNIQILYSSTAFVTSTLGRNVVLSTHRHFLSSKFVQPGENENNENLKTVASLKEKLLKTAEKTNRGFSSTRDERRKASDIVKQLASQNPTQEPASSYYSSSNDSNANTNMNTIAGKWRLVYTDAPDITSLDTTSSSSIFQPLRAATLGRIGQECIPEENSIKNVIEWKRPDWISSLPVPSQTNKNNNNDGTAQSRVLQKVCCQAMADSSEPKIVKLTLIGLDLVGKVEDGTESEEASIDNSNTIWSSFSNSITKQVRDGPARILSKNPLELRGPLKLPFGQFEILFLDRDMRIIKTGQGYLAVNIREEDDWF